MNRYQKAVRFIKITARNHAIIKDHDGIRYRCISCGGEIGNDPDYVTREWNNCRAYFHLYCLAEATAKTACFVCGKLIESMGVRHQWGLAHPPCLIKELVRTFAIREMLLQDLKLPTRTEDNFKDTLVWEDDQ